MFQPPPTFLAQLAALALAAGGCEAAPAPPAEQPGAAITVVPSTIDAARARTLTLEKYRLLFASVYVHDARDGSYHLFPPLTESDLRRVVLEADAWHVRCSPTAAHQLYARVAKDGSWVELNEVGHAIR